MLQYLFQLALLDLIKERTDENLAFCDQFEIGFKLVGETAHSEQTRAHKSRMEVSFHQKRKEI